VDAHEGRIDMTTQDGRGTRFRVTLPVESHKQK
jgi:signal transduction histidine kinase